MGDVIRKIRTVYSGGKGEITEKKSRFIAELRPVSSEAEAEGFLEEVRKRSWDARHHCSAYVLGERQELVRASDDGEPSGTAGRPMLDILLGEGLTDTMVVVTRYFGGTLLGTGGLVKAYSAAVQEGLKNSDIIEKTEGSLLTVRTDYSSVGKIQYIIGQNGIPMISSEYGADVMFRVILPTGKESHFRKEITEATGGKAEIEKEKVCWYAEWKGEVLLY